MITINRKMLRVTGLCGLATMLLAIPGEAEACRFLDGLFSCGRQPVAVATTTMYTPAVSSGCTTCTPQVAQYMPRTTYRPFYSRVPVTYYYPTTSLSYGASFGTPCATSCPAPCTNSCGSCGVGSVGCSPCSSGGCSTVMSNTVPTPATTPTVTPAPQTFKQEPQQQPATPQTLQRPIEPVPEPSATRYAPPMPRLTTPDSRTPVRATMREVRPTVRYQMISRTPQHVSTYRTPIDDGGWQASSD